MNVPEAKEQLPVMNPGHNRHGLTVALKPVREIGFFGGIIEDIKDPWAELQWWESPWQAREGIKSLFSRPFLYLPEERRTSEEPRQLFPARLLYSYALHSSERHRVTKAAGFVSAAVRQAREYYAAARSSGVSELSRPVLYFYSAVSLAKAATVALFGMERLSPKDGHGLACIGGPSIRRAQAGWPTVIEWKRKGEFPVFYRATRWDALYNCCDSESRWATLPKDQMPKVHILECIRWLGYDWGALPNPGFERPLPGVRFRRTPREERLLHYVDGRHFYLKQDTPPESTLLEAPRIVVLYMVLFYFSVLARYHPLQWQKLLAGTVEHESGVLRVALDRAAADFVEEIVHLFPRESNFGLWSLPVWQEQRPPFDVRFVPQPPASESIALGVPEAHLPEWDGTPLHICP